MATVKLTFAGDSGLNWQTGQPTPNHSYASVLLLDDRPHSEQLKAYYPCDDGKDTPLLVTFDEINRTFNVNEIQLSAPCGKSDYDPRSDDVVLYRETQLDPSYVTFTDGAKLTAATLNLETDQLLHLIQELDARLEETNPYWKVLPDFTCELTASIQCDVTDLLARMTQEELNVDNLQTWVGGQTTNNSNIPHKWNYTLDRDVIELADGNMSPAFYNVASLFDHSRALHHYVRDLRDDVNWLLGQAPAYDGAYVESVTSLAPCDAEGTPGLPTTGCSYVKLTFNMSHGVKHEVIYPANPYITDISGNDTSHQFSLTFTYCDGSTELVGPFSKFQGPQGDVGPEGPRGNKGDGFFCWRTGPLMELGHETPNMNNLPQSYSNICYFVTYDEPVETNPLKGVAGGLMQELSPQFGGPGNTVNGTGDYSGYILRYQDMGGHFKWVSTDTQWFQGAQVSGAPVKYFWNSTQADALTYPILNSGSFMVDTPDDLTTVELLRLPYVDATGNDLEVLLTAYTQGVRYHEDDGIGTVILSNEKSPGRCAFYRINHVIGTWSNLNGEGIDLEVEHLGSSSNFPFDLHGNPVVGRDRICFHFQKHGQVPANTHSWSQLFYEDNPNWHPPNTILTTIPQNTIFIDSLIKVPDTWSNFVLRAASVHTDQEILAVNTGLDPRLKFTVWYTSAYRIETQEPDDWTIGAQSIGTIQSYVGPDYANQHKYAVKCSPNFQEITLSPPNNGYIFIQSNSHPAGVFPDNPKRARLHLELDGHVLLTGT
tara:strand:- start:8307 stop:10610 length:2304 start_codon:yes stop_codon:yes gene_type:complete